MYTVYINKNKGFLFIIHTRGGGRAKEEDKKRGGKAMKCIIIINFENCILVLFN